MLSRTRKRSRAGAALGSRTSELGSGTPWAEADRGRELEQMREQETRSGFMVGSPARVRVLGFFDLGISLGI